MGKLVGKGRGQILRQQCEPTPGRIIINKKLDYIIDVDLKNGTITKSDDVKILIDSVNITGFFVKIRSIEEGNEKLVGKLLPLKFTQWKYASRDEEKVVNIEIDEVDPKHDGNLVLVAKMCVERPKITEQDNGSDK